MAKECGVLQIFDIQRFCVHDGPGIRTTVFLKGCPMRCPWCANPESQRFETELLYVDNQCVRCGQCAAACPKGVIDFSGGEPRFDRASCDHCGRCESACPRSAIRLVGRTATVADILAVVLRDVDYYRNTHGGLTLSGGEPLCQPQGALTLLAAAKRAGLHTALETTASVPEDVFLGILPAIDLCLIDLKHADADTLKAATGADLPRVLSNLAMAAKAKKAVVRIPVIPGFNASEEALAGIFRLARACGADQADLLAYHVLGKGKYAQLGRTYPFAEEKPLDKGALEPFRTLGHSLGLSVTIGGK
ncbi:MAG TPA: glycyl-radical enzyme activating protein [Clostridia bacterium]|nr:glycyl-radical enzyme activating protein [Clostridia bacterium]